MQRLFGLVFLCAVTGCGGSTSPFTAAATSTWAGTYTGNLEFSGCPGTTACGGDSVTITISESPNPAIPGEFSPTLTITGTDSTKNETITGTGTALYYGAAPTGPGSSDTNANATISPGGSIFLSGSGQSTTGPVLIDTIVVNNASTVTGVGIVKGSLYFGTLTRAE